jgi:anti-sigma factor RsiW
MSHPSEMISAFLDGELDAQEAAGLKAHLASCGRCAGDLGEFQRVRSAVRSLPLLELPAGLVSGADAELIPLRRHRGVMVGAAAAIVALVVAFAAMLTPPSPTVSIDDLSSRFGARVSLDPAFGPAKVVVPDWETEGIEEE